MRHTKVWPFFLIALFCQSLLPSPCILAFAPFLAIAYSRFKLIPSLWLAAFSGLILDLFAASFPFGIHALNYTLTTLFVHRYRHYIVDKPIGFASFICIFSILSTGLQWTLLLLFGTKLPFTFQGLTTDFLVMPLLDALYAFLCFSCPVILYHFLRNQWFRFLFFKKETKRKNKELAKL